MFSEDELIKNTLTNSSRTDRGTLSPTRVKLLKDSMIQKFKLEGPKKDQSWLLVIQAVNSKGRQLKFNAKFRKIMAKLNVTRKQKDSVADDAEKPPCSSDSENETLKKTP